MPLAICIIIDFGPMIILITRGQISFQSTFSVNVWTCVIDRKIIGSHFLTNTLLNTIDDRPNCVSTQLCFKTTGARQILGWTSQNFRVILSDLAPLDSQDWCRAKELVNQVEICTKEEFILQVNSAFAIMKGEIRVEPFFLNLFFLLLMTDIFS